MKLQDIYDQLSYGELRDVFLGSGTDGDTTDKEDFIRLLPSLVTGLTSLHTRFRLREGRLTVALTEGKASYMLLDKFAVSNTRSQETKYIMDALDPFLSNLLKVEEVWGTWNGADYRIPLNKAGNKGAIRTPTLHSLLVPTDSEDAPWLLETTELKLVYRQDHPAMDIAVANAAPSVTDIELPLSHLEALLYFMASRITNPLGMTPGAMHEGNNYAQKYDIKCSELSDLGLEVDNDSENTRAEANGWV